MNPTDSFTFHIPLPAEPLPTAPASYPEGITDEDDEELGDERTVVVDRRPQAEWALRLESGERILVDGTLLLGRKPASSAGPAGARLITVDDSGRTLSRSHIVVEAHPGAGIVIRDVSSANGIVLVAEDGAESEIEAGGEVRIAHRCEIVLGRYRIGIEPV